MSLVSVASAVLSRVLPASGFQKVRFAWWYGSRWATSLVNYSTPKVSTFAGPASKLVAQIEHVNVMAPTLFCRVMTKHGSDKGRDWHNYTTVYSALFEPLRALPITIMELGLGTTNPDIRFNMGVDGTPGASLRGWRDLFPRARVFGADIDRSILFEEDRIQTFYCDQLDQNAIADLWAHDGLRDGADIIVDDGLHTFEGNDSFLSASLKHLKPGGIFIVEDIYITQKTKWLERVRDFYAKEYPDREFLFIELPNPENKGNNLLLVR